MSMQNNERVKGFLHANGMKFVNGDNEQIILNGNTHEIENFETCLPAIENFLKD